MGKQTPAETFAQYGRVRPVLKPFFEAFGPLVSQRLETAGKIAPMLAAAGIGLPPLPENGPLLPGRLPQGLGPFVRLAAEDILPVLATLEAMALHEDAFAAFFLADGNGAALETLVSAMLDDDPSSLGAVAQEAGLAPEVLGFAAEFIVSAVLRGLAPGTAAGEFEGWRKGVCPVCGSRPIIAWLGKRPAPAQNEFLVDGGGGKRLHCGLCGTDWRFLRGVCPGCGQQGEDARQILGEVERRHERIDWCKTCGTYLPQIDLRELADEPDMDAMALCLMHLDMAAAEKGLAPLKPSFWNMY